MFNGAQIVNCNLLISLVLMFYKGICFMIRVLQVIRLPDIKVHHHLILLMQVYMLYCQMKWKHSHLWPINLCFHIAGCFNSPVLCISLRYLLGVYFPTYLQRKCHGCGEPIIQAFFTFVLLLLRFHVGFLFVGLFNWMHLTVN